MAEQRILSLAELLAAPDAGTITEVVELAELGAVRIHAFSKATHSRMLREATGTDGKVDQDRLETLALVNGVAEPALAEADAEALRQKRWGAVQSIMNRIWSLSGMDRFGSGNVTAEAVEEAEKAFRP
jgi:phage head maturation protease